MDMGIWNWVWPEMLIKSSPFIVGRSFLCCVEREISFSTYLMKGLKWEIEQNNKKGQRRKSK